MRALAMILALTALAGCDNKQTVATKDSAFGEVLPGSASDAMLPYDTATSAPPLEAPEAGLSAGSSVPDVSATDAVAPDGDIVPEVEAT